MSTLLQDLRYAVRTLTKSSSITIFAVASLALGIGANTAIFSVVDAFLWRPFPVSEPGRLVMLFTTDKKNEGLLPVSRLNYEDFRDKTDVFSGVGATSFAAVDLTVDNDTTRVPALVATGNYFDVLGVRPILGGGFRANQDEPPGANPVVVLSNGCWKRRFAADPAIVGRTITINHAAYTVLGVLPESFTGTFPGFAPDLWLPYGMREHVLPGITFMIENRRGLWLTPIARLNPGVTKDRAESALQTLAANLEKEYPDSNLGRGAAVATLAEARANPGGARQNPLPRMAALLMVAVGLILLIACANVANLLLARASARQSEIAIRIAIGAGRWRLFRQLLCESLVLSFAGAVGGVLVAQWFTTLLMSLQPPGPFPFVLGARIDLRVLLFTIAIAMLTGVVFGLAPALQASNLELHGKLKEGRGQADTGGKGRLRRVLVAAEVALATVALVATGLLIRSLHEATQIDPGFKADNVLTLNLDVSLQAYDPARGAQFYRQLVERARTLPGVKSAAITSRLPLAFGLQRTVRIEGEVPSDAERGVLVNVNTVGTDYFQTLEVPIVAGRAFDVQETETSPLVVIVNQTMAKRFWPGRDPIGQALRLRTGRSGEEYTEPMRVVGVARDSKYVTLGEQPTLYLYLPFRQNYTAAMALLVRTERDSASVLGPIRREVSSLDPGLPIFNVQPLTTQIDGALFLSRVGAYLLAAFGALALVLTTVGTYGVIAYTVTRRTPEIGLRMALGAGPARILAMIVGSGMRLAAVGIGIGLALALFLGRALTPILYGVHAGDPTTFVAVALGVTAVALVATILPARRASRVDPMIALRTE